MCVVRSQSRAGVLFRLIAGAGLALMSGLAAADYQLNLSRPVTATGIRAFELHNLIFFICVVIFIVVFGAILYSIIKHRKSSGRKPATFHDNVKWEIGWTVVPFLILVAMAIPSTAVLLEMADTSQADMSVKITGFQWKWHYEYPDQDVSFFSTLSTPREQIENKAEKGPNYLHEVDNPLVLPVGKKIRLLITANDVIHSWWVEAFGIKTDAIPGFINESWVRIDEPGTYRGVCAELCGKDHGFMPIVVEAKSQEDFDKWAASQKQKAAAEANNSNKVWTKDDLMARGQKIFQTCAACHGQKGEGLANFPRLAGSKVATGPLAGHLKIVLHGGRPGTAMPAFAAQLSDADIAAVVTFERNSFGNHTGDVVQPSQVKAAR